MTPTGFGKEPQSITYDTMPLEQKWVDKGKKFGKRNKSFAVTTNSKFKLPKSRSPFSRVGGSKKSVDQRTTLNFVHKSESAKKCKKILMPGPEIEFALASPNEHLEAREILKGRNLLPYLN